MAERGVSGGPGLAWEGYADDGDSDWWCWSISSSTSAGEFGPPSSERDDVNEYALPPNDAGKGNLEMDAELIEWLEPMRTRGSVYGGCCWPSRSRSQLSAAPLAGVGGGISVETLRRKRESREPLDVDDDDGGRESVAIDAVPNR